MDNYFSQFEQFTSLPTELQSENLSEYKNVLSKTPTISKQVKNITKQSFLTDICTLPINHKEIKNYLKKYSVDSLIYFYNENLPGRVVHMAAMKYVLVDADNTNTLTYNLNFEVIDSENNVLKYNIIKDDDLYHKIHKIERKELDLITQYYIYKERKCDSLQLNFSKNLILNHLRNKYNQYYKNNYQSLLCLYLYWRVNLQNFPVKLLKNVFLNYNVVIDTDDNIVEIQPLGIEDPPLADGNIMIQELMTIIKSRVDELYQLLLKEINKLD